VRAHLQDLLTELVSKATSEENSGRRGFNQSVQIYINLRDIDVKKPENRFAVLVELPHVSEKMHQNVGVITEGGALSKARELGLKVLTRQQLESAAGDKKAARALLKDIDLLIAEAPLMPLVGRVFGPFLGPTDRMPTPFPPNSDITPVAQRLGKSVLARLKGQRTVSALIGTSDMSSDQLRENAMKLVSELERRVPNGIKSFDSVTIKTTMGRPVRSKVRAK